MNASARATPVMPNARRPRHLCNLRDARAWNLNIAADAIRAFDRLETRSRNSSAVSTRASARHGRGIAGHDVESARRSGAFG